MIANAGAAEALREVRAVKQKLANVERRLALAGAGGGGGGGVVWADDPPADTSALWVDTNAAELEVRIFDADLALPASDPSAWITATNLDDLVGVAHLAGAETFTGDKTVTGRLAINGPMHLDVLANNAADFALTATDRFRVRYGGAGGHTCTLPTLAGLDNLGYLIENRGGGDLTIARSGTNLIDVGGNLAATSFKLRRGESAFVLSNSIGDAWNVSIMGGGSTGDVERVQSFTTSGTIAVGAGSHVTYIGASGNTLTLPASPMIGERFRISNLDPTDRVTLARAGSQVIYPTPAGSVTSMPVYPGESFEIVYHATNEWRIYGLDRAGKRIPGSLTEYTSDYSSPVASGAGVDLAYSWVTGDGHHKVKIRCTVAILQMFTAGPWWIDCRDAASGAGNLLEQRLFTVDSAGGYWFIDIEFEVPAFTGEKQFAVRIVSAVGATSNITVYSSGTRARRIYAEFV